MLMPGNGGCVSPAVDACCADPSAKAGTKAWAAKSHWPKSTARGNCRDPVGIGGKVRFERRNPKGRSLWPVS